jgi:DNA-binding IclR family transcriptional regulator
MAAPLRRYTERTVVDPKLIARQLKQIRTTKVGLDNQEFMPGLIGIAVPVFDSRGRVWATVSMHAPTVRWTIDRVLKLVPHLTAAANRVARTLSPKLGDGATARSASGPAGARMEARR